MELFNKSLAIFALIALIETLHGILRAKFLAKKVGDLRSRQIGVITGSILIYIITFNTLNWVNPKSVIDCLIIGSIWLIFMLLFEFIVGHYVFHFPFKWLIDEYNVKKGRWLLFGMIFLFFSPLIVFSLN